MEKSKPLNIYNVYLYCDKCGGLMKAIDSLAGTGTHSLGYNYCCEQCGTIVTSFIRYPYIRYGEKENETYQS